MVSPPDIRRTVRNVKRYGEIISVLVRYGFEDIVLETGLHRLVERGLKVLGIGKPLEGVEEMSRPVRLRQAMEELGPTFIKVGQVLSLRPDLIPPEWAEEFRKLQHQCPQVPFAEIEERIAAAFPPGSDKIFATIERDALAAGSMAQVHRGVLLDGTRVVLKVLRPGIAELLDCDMEILQTLAAFAEQHFSNLGYSPVQVVDELAKELRLEVDLTHEGRSTERLRRYFLKDAHVSFPKVYWHATTRDLLTLDEVQGVLLSSRRPGDFTPEELRAIVANGADAVFKQCLEFGFFHADPHPGNIIVQPGGNITFIDCGMTGRIDQRTSEALADLFHAVVTADLDRVIRVIGTLTDIEPTLAASRPFRADVWEFVARFETGTFESLDVGVMLQEFFSKLRKHGVRCPSDIVFLIKALTTIEGVGAELDPSFDVVSLMTPRVKRLLTKRFGVRALGRRMRSTMQSFAELVEDLPRSLMGLLGQLRRNDFSISLEHRRLERLTDTIEHASRNVAYALIITGLIVGSSILVLSERMREGSGVFSTIGVIGLAVSAVLTVLIVLANLRRNR